MASKGIAIVGLACRFPGAKNAAEYWQNLLAGKECSTHFSPEELRAEGVPEHVIQDERYVPVSYGLDNIDGFDNQLFECSARESELMDPQHRLFLEVAWEAFEDAGYAPNAVPGIVGAYAGIGGVVSSYLVDILPDNEDILGPTGGLQHVGNDKDFIATRVSFKLDLKGPGVNVQSACSTSMLAVHLACQALLNRECDMAIAGASTIRVPHRQGYLSEEGGIHAPDGHCRPFDKDAAGTIFASGVGAVILKPVEAAMAAGDQIYAVIRASAVSNDGAKKVSYTATNAEGQARAITEGIALSGVDADSIGYIEAHGTGTHMGDPIEVDALSRSFRLFTKKRQFCALGSVKSNLGHMEQSAGMASIIKTALILKTGAIPPSINFSEPNPRIKFETTPFYMALGCTEWRNEGPIRRAGINALGIGGTNVFTVLEQPPTPAIESSVEREAHIVVLSAQSEAAATQLATRYGEALEKCRDEDLANFCFTANAGRAKFDYRAFAVGRFGPDLAAGIARTEPRKVDREGAPKLAFLYTGQGSQYAKMTSTLYATQPTFRQAIDRCDEILRPYLETPLMEVLEQEDGSLLNQTGYAQPATFALQYALTTMLASWGIKPDFVMGHSVGEFAASCAAGIFNLETGLRLIAERGRLMQAEPAGGEMAAIFANRESVTESIDRLEAKVSIAALNAPEITVVSGPGEEVQKVVADFRSRRIGSRKLNVSHAFHSRLMDPMLEPFETFASQFTFGSPKVGYISNVTGAKSDVAPDAAYFRTHVAQPVCFTQGMQALYDEGCRYFVEIGPGTTLTGLGQQTLDSSDCHWLPSIAKEGRHWRDLLNTLGELFVAGYNVDWKAFDADYSRRRMSIPTYPFQHRRFWMPKGSGRRRGQAGKGIQPFLSRRIPSPLADIQFEAAWSLRKTPYLTDHRMYGLAILPTTVGLNVAMSAALQVFGPGKHSVEDMVYYEAVEVPDQDENSVQLILSEQGADAYSFELFILTTDENPTWLKHMSGTLRRASSDPAPETTDELVRGDSVLESKAFYETGHRVGLNYGPGFQLVQDVSRREGEAVAAVKWAAGDRSSGEFVFDPVVLDGCLHLYAALFGETAEGDGFRPTYLPFAIERYQVFRTPTAEDSLTSRLKLRSENEKKDTAVVDIAVFDGSNAVIAEIQGLSLKRLSKTDLFPSRAAQITNWLYQVDWQAKPFVATDAVEEPRAWIVFADEGGVGASLASSLEARGHRCLSIRLGDLGGEIPDPVNSFRPLPSHDFGKALSDVAGLGLPVGGFIHLWGLDNPADSLPTTGALDDMQRVGPGSLIQLVQALGAVDPTPFLNAKLWIGTRSTQPVGETTIRSEFAANWGIARTLVYENSDVWGGIVDLDSDTNPADDAAKLVNQILRGDGESESAWRGEERFVPRIVRLPKSVPMQPIQSMRSDATYLITGGLGVIGAMLAKLLYERGARNLVLTGRRAPSEESEAAIAELALEGADIRYVQMDASNFERVVEVVGEISTSMPPLRGIFQCAGVLINTLLSGMTWDQWIKVSSPKIAGTWNLHRASDGLELDHFVPFSSVLSVIGTPGSGNYTAANAYIDSLGHLRRQQGLPSLVFNWGPWAEVGMAASEGDRGAAFWAKAGTAYIPPDKGMEIIDKMLDSGVPQVAITITEWGPFLTQFPSSGRPHLFDELAKTVAPTGNDAARGKLAAMLREASPAQRAQIATEEIVKLAMKTLGLDPTSEFDVSKPITSYGLDSLLALNLRTQIEDALGGRVPFAKLMQGSVTDLVEALFPE